MSKTFKFVGVSRRNGTMKARFANDMTRVKVLAKTGSSDIDLIELEHPMTKEAAVAYLLQINFDQGNREVRAALEADLSKRTPSEKAPRAKTAKTVKAAPKKAAKSKPSMDSIKAKAQAAKAKATAVSKADVEKQLEDAPF